MTRKILLIIPFIILLTSCSEYNKQNDTSTKKNEHAESIVFPEQSLWTKTVIDSLGEDITKFNQKEFVLYCKKESYAEKNHEYLIALIDSAVARIKTVLSLNQIPNGFYLVMLDSRKEMERLIGMNVKGLASGRNNTALFVFNSGVRPYFKHELFHLISYNVWGEPQSRVLNEGGAMYTDNECLNYDNPISTLNKFLFSEKKWFSIEGLITNFSDKARENDMIAYLESAFIFRFLFENYGRDKMKELWNAGFPEFEKIYGFNISDLEMKIKNELKGIGYKKVDWDELMKKGCG